MEKVDEEASLPSNYVSILQLRERWLQRNHQNAQDQPRNDHDGDSRFNPKSSDDAALKRVPRRNRYTPRPNRHRMIDQSRTEVRVSDSHPKTQVDVEDDHPKGETEEHKTDHSNSKLAKKKVLGAAKPRVATDRNPNGGGSPLLEPEPDPAEGKKHFHGGRGRNRNQKVVLELKGKTAPLAQSVDDLSLDEACADGVIAAAAVKESNVPNVSEGTNKRWVSGRFQGKTKPNPRSGSNRPSQSPFWGKKVQSPLVWVKKGESAAN